MSDLPPSKPNVSMSLIVFHRVITRGLGVSRQNGREFAQEGFSDAALRDGYAKYVRTLSEVINVHHMVEDELAFPYFREKIAEAPYPRLRLDHEHMLPILEKINAAVEKVRDEQREKEGLQAIDEALREFAPLWAPHIEIEEKHFDPEKLARLIPVDEHIRLIGEFTAYSQQHSGPPSLVIPFVLYNLPPGPRQAMMGGIPAEVTEKLVPVVWRPDWASMEPFLDL